jgi:hypothetical protein
MIFIIGHIMQMYDRMRRKIFFVTVKMISMDFITI